MTSLIIGGSGLIGRRLSEVLAHRTVGVTATTRQRSGLPAISGVRWKTLDLATFQDWDELLVGVDSVYHFAWSTIPASAVHDPARDISDNVVGTVRMLEAARHFPGLRIVFASSGGTVYGAAKPEPISEDHPTRPLSAYGISKLMVEHYIDKYRTLYGVDAVALRISNCYDSGQRAEKGLGALTLFARAALRGQPITIYGSGDIVRDFVHVDDVVAAAIAAAERRNVQGPINIGSGLGVSLNGIIGHLETALQRTLSIQYAASRPFDVPASVLDIRRAYQRIGWRPEITFARGMTRLLDELRAEMEPECESPSSSTATIQNTSSEPSPTPAPSPANSPRSDTSRR